MTTQIATIKSQRVDGINAKSHRKENSFYYQYTLVGITAGGDFANLAELRLYATQAKHYACLWVHNGETWLNGSGSAGGYGYHKASQAAEGAFSTAGVQLSQPIGGRGDEAVQDALLALGKALGEYTKLHVLTAHA